MSDTLSLVDDVYPEGSERQAAVAFADELGDKRATSINLHEYMTMLFYAPEKRDAFIAGVPATAYSKEVNKAVDDDLARDDMNVAPLVAYRIHRAIAGSKFLVFECSGHLPFVEEPGGFLHAARGIA